MKKTTLVLLLGLSCSASAQDADDVDRFYDRLEQQDTTALTALTDLAQRQDPYALAVLGFVYEFGVSVPKNTQQDIIGQTQEILATIDQLLLEANTDKSRLLSAHVYIKNLDDFATFNTIWIDWLEGCVAPSRATIQADLVNPDWLIEIAVIAAQA